MDFQMEILWKDFQQAVYSIVFCANHRIRARFYGYIERKGHYIST